MTRPAEPPAPLPLGNDGLLPAADFATLSSACGPAFVVFAQQTDARIDLAAWNRHAAQFFAAAVQLSRPKHYDRAPPRADAAHVRVEHRDGSSNLATVFLRPRTDVDLALAERAEGGGGLALLAKRCATVVMVPVIEPPDEALFLAALLSSVLLGPILTPDRARLIGARTARLELEKRRSHRN